MPMQEVVVCSLGRVEYEPTWKLQRQVQQALIAAKRADPPQLIPHVLMLVEHPPVYTLGKSGDSNNLLVSESFLSQRGATFFHIDRGGDITFHGPGQVVGYPILDLDRFRRDLHVYLRNLEEVMIRLCRDYGVETIRVKGKTGVWIDTGDESQSRKICAMGIRCSRWVTMHGFAYNINTDLSYFNYIIPCGIQNRTVTSLQNELGRSVDEEEVKSKLLGHFSDVFEVKLQILGNQESIEYLQELIGDTVPRVN